jgi:hypothetical protein
MYALIKNHVVEKYPYSFGQLMADNPQTSFPSEPPESTFAEWGVFKVTTAQHPNVDHTKNVTEGQPTLIDGQWTQTWVVSDASVEEVEQRTNNQAVSVRAERNNLIAKCDWTQVDDTPLTNTKRQEWAAYRQSLRDITAQSGFPWQVVWPEQPK